MCVLVYVLLSTYYEPGIVLDTGETVNRSPCPLRAFILFSKKLLRWRINAQTSAKESLPTCQAPSEALEKTETKVTFLLVTSNMSFNVHTWMRSFLSFSSYSTNYKYDDFQIHCSPRVYSNLLKSK